MDFRVPLTWNQDSTGERNEWFCQRGAGRGAVSASAWASAASPVLG